MQNNDFDLFHYSLAAAQLGLSLNYLPQTRQWMLKSYSHEFVFESIEEAKEFIYQETKRGIER